jgi:hypothetical protein
MNEGNSLLVPLGEGKYDLFAVDQSDCFGGAGCFSNGSWQRAMQTRGKAEDAGCLSEAIFDCGGPEAVEGALKRADVAYSSLDSIVGEVPEVLWRESGITPPLVREELERRYRRLRPIVDPQSWPDPKSLRGGHLLGGGA